MFYLYFLFFHILSWIREFSFYFCNYIRGYIYVLFFHILKALPSSRARALVFAVERYTKIFVFFVLLLFIILYYVGGSGGDGAAAFASNWPCQPMELDLPLASVAVLFSSFWPGKHSGADPSFLVNWLPNLSSEYWLGLVHGGFYAILGCLSLGGIAIGLFYYFRRPKPGGGRPNGGQDASIQTDAPVYLDAIVDTQDLPVLTNSVDAGVNTDELPDNVDIGVNTAIALVEASVGSELPSYKDALVDTQDLPISTVDAETSPIVQEVLVDVEVDATIEPLLIQVRDAGVNTENQMLDVETDFDYIHNRIDASGQHSLHFILNNHEDIVESFEELLADHKCNCEEGKCEIKDIVLLDSFTDVQLLGSDLTFSRTTLKEVGIETDSPSYSSALLGPDSVLPEKVMVDVEVDATLPAPLSIPPVISNFALSEAVLLGGASTSNLTSATLQELEVYDSPPYVWPTATTGHISQTPIDQLSPADTTELIEYGHLLEEKRSIGVNTIPELIPLPLSPIIHANAGVNTDDVPVRAEYGVNTDEVIVLQPSDIQVPVDNLLTLSGGPGLVTPLSPNEAPLSTPSLPDTWASQCTGRGSVDKFYELIDEGLIPPLPQSQWMLDALNGPMPEPNWWVGAAPMIAGDALNTPLPPSTGSDLFEDGEASSTAGGAGMDIVNAITTIM